MYISLELIVFENRYSKLSEIKVYFVYLYKQLQSSSKQKMLLV